MSILDMMMLKILAPGMYKTDSGNAVVLAKYDLRNMASAYNGNGTVKRPAKLVIGHPENDAPSWGEVAYLDFEENTGNLIARVDKYKGMRDALRRALAEGSIGRHSAQFFAPDNPNNPVPNTWYLKHLGFAGPPPSAPTGTLTPDVEFAEYVEVFCPESTGGFGVFAQYATAPKDPGTIAALARAYHDEYRSRIGREVSFAECVRHVTGSNKTTAPRHQGGSGKPALAGQTSRFPEIVMPADSLTPWGKK